MSEFLFSEFNEVSAKQWKQKIQVDLKGADYNDTLVWQSGDGIHVKPFYHSDDFNEEFAPIPGQPDRWSITQAVFIENEFIANKLAIDALSRGAEAVIFTSENEFDIEKVFENYPFQLASIYFNLKFLKEDFILNLINFISKKKATVYYNIDPIGNLARTGNWFHSLTEDHRILENIIQDGQAENTIGVNASLYQNAGANRVQQLAYALAQANEYLNHFQHKKEIRINFTLSIDSNYFFEIAKIRALRKLYAALAKQYHFNETCHILCVPSKRNKTLYDYNNNMLRTTTECMSSILGGANAISNLPYDSIYHKSNEFGERISRNQLLILKTESYFDSVSNPADGAYYIESLTQELADKALELFKEIELNGGFLHQLKEGTIQRKVKESAAKEQELFDSGKLVLLGTNKHPNEVDRMKDNLELYPFVKIKPRKTLLEPIIERRLSEKMEQERLDHE